MAKELNKFGEGFDREEFASPVVVGPAKGQEGWNPSNPEVDGPRDPMGYLSEHEEGRGRRR
jgi:hypothetical protein